MQRQKRYGHGKWPRKQLYAIVASYRSMGRKPEWIASRLGVGPKIVGQIFEYLDWLEDEGRGAQRFSGRPHDESA
jgi:hypothetical protein